MEIFIIIIVFIVIGYLIYKSTNQNRVEPAKPGIISDIEINEANEIRNSELYKKIEKIITSRNVDMIRNDVFSRHLNEFSNIVYTNIVVTEDRVAKFQSGGSTGWPDELTNEILFRDFGYNNLNSHQIKILTIALGMMQGYNYQCETNTVKVVFVESYWNSIFKECLNERDKNLKSL